METKKISFCFIALMLFGFSKANNLADNQHQYSSEIPERYVFNFVDTPPEFPDGAAAMFQYIAQNMNISASSQEVLPQGRIVLQFVVLKSGEIVDIKVLRGLDPLLDQEAVRVVESMPKWIPGSHNGEVVNAQYILPISIVRSSAPQFVGGDEALHHFLLENIDYGQGAQDSLRNGFVQGRVCVQFNVSKLGEISNVRVVNSVAPSLDKEVVRVIESMPAWIPAKQRGEGIDAQYNLSINFQLVWLGEPMPTDFPLVEARPEDFVFPIPMRFAEFHGGVEALMRFLNENIRYPPFAWQNRIEGRVIVDFVIEPTGDITDIRVSYSADRSLEAEAIRVVRKMPRWRPAMINGEFLRVRFSLPINFVLP